MSKIILSAENITKSFEGVNALRGVSIELPTSHALTILGPNGSGKSVLLRALCLVEYPDHGIVELFDKRVSFPNDNKDHISIWPQATCSFQDTRLFPHLSIRQNIELTSRFRISGDGPEFSWQASIEKLGLSSILDKYPQEVSGGEAQIADLIGLLNRRPKILFLDEPSSNLDVERIDHLENLLTAYKSNGGTLVFSTHLFGFAINMGDLFLFLDNGNKILFGTQEELLSSEHPKIRKFLEYYSLGSHKKNNKKQRENQPNE